MRDRLKPSFFLVGAPKCGTTSMAYYLGDHPDVFMSDPKEPNFFCKDIPQTREVRSFAEYMELFPRDHEGAPAVVGEASTWYLYSRVAAEEIYRFNPRAAVLAMVRDPVDMVYSLHSQLVYNQIEPEKDFELAWRLQDRRPDREFLQYRKVGSLGDQLERLLSVFPTSQVKVVVFDEFAARPKGVYEDVLGFLGLNPSGRERFPAHNENKQLRSEVVARFVRNTPQPVSRCIGWIKDHTAVEEFGLLKRIQDWNTRAEPREPLHEGFREELAEEFRPQVEKLEALLGRNLDQWKRG